MMTNRLKHIVKFPFHLMIYMISRMCEWVHRDNSIWAFGCHTGFGDNAKFFFFEVNEHHQEIRAIWIAHRYKDVKKIRTLGYESYFWLSGKGLYYSLIAGVYVYTRVPVDINRFFSGGAFLLTLNHGVGLKKLYWTNEFHLQKEYGKSIAELENSFYFKVLTYIGLFRTPDLCLVTSRDQKENFYTKQFRIPMSFCIGCKTPRIKMFFKSDEEIICMARRYEPVETESLINRLSQYKKIYIYMPTWRNDNSDFIESSMIDFEELNDIMKQQNMLFILKLHPYTKINIKNISQYSNILNYNNRIDIYYILPYTDCLITDYSSIYTDYLTMNKEVILFTFDKKRYLERCVELENYDNYYKGVEISTFGELLSIIKSNKDCHLSESDYLCVMDLFWSYIDIPVDIVEEVKKRLN